MGEDGVIGCWYLMEFFYFEGVDKDVMVVGMYVDEYVKEDGVWWFKSCVYYVLYFVEKMLGVFMLLL